MAAVSTDVLQRLITLEAASRRRLWTHRRRKDTGFESVVARRTVAARMDCAEQFDMGENASSFECAAMRVLCARELDSGAPLCV